MNFKGPRKMTVLIPGLDNAGELRVCQPTRPSETLLAQYNAEDPDVLALNNKTPQWNEGASFCLLALFAHTIGSLI